jgi:hypothetical protein
VDYLAWMLKRIELRENGCWIWTGANGLPTCHYGQVRIGRNGKTVHAPAHRFMYELVKGSIPKGLYACHVCDTPLCVNPDHIFLGTIKDNAQDAFRKGRFPDVKGANAPNSKLTQEQVNWIRSFPKENRPTGRALARQLNVSEATISSILLGQTWYNSLPSTAQDSGSEPQRPVAGRQYQDQPL